MLQLTSPLGIRVFILAPVKSDTNRVFSLEYVGRRIHTSLEGYHIFVQDPSESGLRCLTTREERSSYVGTVGIGPKVRVAAYREAGAVGRCLAPDGTGGRKLGDEVYMTFVLKGSETVSG